MYYRRKIQAKIEKKLKDKDVLVLTGMRRTGKTTMLRDIYSRLPGNKIWFDFENPINIKLFQDIDFDDVYENIVNKGLDRDKRIHVFIDEVQQYPDINKVVKYLHDHYDIKFILTGSASFYLKNLFTESLAGRKTLFELFPLDFEEFLLFKEKDMKRFLAIREKDRVSEIEYEEYDKLYDEYLLWGGFPQVVLARNRENRENRLEEIFSSYWQNEILNLADYKKNEKVRDLILLLAARVGSKLDVQKISQELGVARSTLYSYLSFLEATYFIFTIQPFSQSIDREVTGTPKVYFCDNGLLQILAKVNEGQILENSVFNQLQTSSKLNYYQKRSGQEIDFVLNKRAALEVKQTATKSDARRIDKLAEKLKLNEAYLVSKNYTKDIQDIKHAQFL